MPDRRDAGITIRSRRENKPASVLLHLLRAAAYPTPAYFRRMDTPAGCSSPAETPHARPDIRPAAAKTSWRTPAVVRAPSLQRLSSPRRIEELLPTLPGLVVPTLAPFLPFFQALPAQRGAGKSETTAAESKNRVC